MGHFSCRRAPGPCQSHTLQPGRWVLATIFVLSCGDREHAEFIDPDQPKVRPKIEDAADTASRDRSGDAGGKNDAGKTTATTPAQPANSPGGGSSKPPKSISFQEGDVYVMGYLKDELAGQRALMDLAMPDTFSVGFDWVSGRPVIQGDELLYPSSREEPAAYFGFASDLTASSELDVSDYPSNPMANDRRIEVPVCALFGLDIGPIRLASSPDGLVAYKCDDGWHVMSGTSYRVSVDITALGRDQLAWTEGDTLVRFASDDTYETIPVVGLPDAPTTAVRAHGDGFRLVVAKAHAELWEVSADGMAKQVGVFPDSPYVSILEESVLTGLGDLIEVNPDQVMRRTLAGDVDVVYNEDDGFVDVGGAWLVISP